MITKSLSVGMVIAMGAALTGCGSSGSGSSSDPERNIIVDKAPFYQKELPYKQGSEGEIIAIVKTFAHEHGMDYLGGPGHPTLKADEFNLHAAGPSLNLGVIRVITTLPNMQVAAIARGNPTANDKAVVADFVARVEKAR